MEEGNTIKQALEELSTYAKRYALEHTFEIDFIQDLVSEKIKKDIKILKEVIKLNSTHYKTVEKYDKLNYENIELKETVEYLRSKLDRLKKYPGLVYAWTPDDTREMAYYCPWCDHLIKGYFEDTEEPDTCERCGNKLVWSKEKVNENIIV